MKALLFEPDAEGRISGSSRVSIIPDSAISLQGRPIVMPETEGELWFRPLIAYRIGRLGKGITSKWAPRYIDSVTTAAAIEVKGTELSPLEATMLAATDNYLTVGDWVKTDDPTAPYTLYIGATGGTPRGEVTEAIVTASRLATLKNGDLILLPVTASPVKAGERLTMKLDGTATLDRRII